MPSNTSLSNWVRTLYQELGQQAPTQPNQVFLLGVREAKKGDQNAYQTISRQALVEDYPTLYDDLIFCVKTSHGPVMEQVEAFKCTFDAGQKYAQARGAPMLCEGQLYHARPCKHGSYSAVAGVAGNNNALTIFSSRPRNIRLVRSPGTLNSNDFKKRTLETLEDAMPEEDFLFCSDTVNDTIHIHFSKELKKKDHVGPWSEGCVVLRYDLGSEDYKRFFKTCAEASNANEIPLLVVSSKYVKLPSDFEANRPLQTSELLFFGKQPGALEQDKMDKSDFRVTRGSKVEKLGYLPSFITRGFAQDALDLIEQLGRVGQAIRQGDCKEDVVGHVAARHRELPKIQQFLFKSKFTLKDAELAEKWRDNLNTSLKRCGFYLKPQSKAFASLRVEVQPTPAVSTYVASATIPSRRGR
jgi:hypothetical protein